MGLTSPQPIKKDVIAHDVGKKSINAVKCKRIEGTLRDVKGEGHKMMDRVRIVEYAERTRVRRGKKDGCRCSRE